MFRTFEILKHRKCHFNQIVLPVGLPVNRSKDYHNKSTNDYALIVAMS